MQTKFYLGNTKGKYQKKNFLLPCRMRMNIYQPIHYQSFVKCQIRNTKYTALRLFTPVTFIIATNFYKLHISAQRVKPSSGLHLSTCRGIPDTFYVFYIRPDGPVGVVGIATRYGLDGPGIESRWGERFSAPFHTGPGAHPASYKMGTGSFLRVKRPGRGVDHLSPMQRRGQRKSRTRTLLPLWAFVACSRENYFI